MVDSTKLAIQLEHNVSCDFNFYHSNYETAKAIIIINHAFEKFFFPTKINTIKNTWKLIFIYGFSKSYLFDIPWKSFATEHAKQQRNNCFNSMSEKNNNNK